MVRVSTAKQRQQVHVVQEETGKEEPWSVEVRGPERNATRYHLRGSLAREREYTYARICGCQWLCSWALFPLIAPAWWTRSNRTGRGEGPLATPRSHARVPCKFRGVSKRATGDERRDGLKIFGLRENVGPPRDSFHPIDFIKRLMDLVRIEGSSDRSLKRTLGAETQRSEGPASRVAR